MVTKDDLTPIGETEFHDFKNSVQVPTEKVDDNFDIVKSKINNITQFTVENTPQLTEDNVFDADMTVGGTIYVDNINPVDTNGDIILGLGTGGLYDDTVTPQNKYLFKSEIQTLINDSSGAVIMTGATDLLDGNAGLVPIPVAGDDVAILKGDATWGLLEANNIAADAVTTAKILDGAITAAKIADGTIIAADVMDNTLTTAKIISTSKTGLDAKLVTGTAGTTDNLTSWNADGDAVDSGISIAQARAGQLVKVSESTLGSTSTVTSTSSTDSGLGVTYTPVSSSQDRYIEGNIDWEVSDTAGNKAEAFIELQYSANGSSWSTLQTFTNNIEVNAGKKLVGSSQSTLSSQISTTSTSYVDTGVQVDYTAISGANDRYIEFQGVFETSDNDNTTDGLVELEYYNGSTWVALEEVQFGNAVTGGTATRVTGSFAKRVLHQVSDDTPQYRLAYRDASSGTATLFAAPRTVTLRVQEYASNTITTKRQPYNFSYIDTVTSATPFYRLNHYVTSGDSSKIYLGSTLRVSEMRDV